VHVQHWMWGLGFVDGCQGEADSKLTPRHMNRGAGR
jgi:hypothetical protein